MATQATGTPAGICTMDSSESMPPRSEVFMGTPTMGSGVYAATTQMGGLASRGDDDPDATLGCGGRPLTHLGGGAVCRGDDELVGNAKLLELLDAGLHGRKVRFGAHDDPHEWCVCHCIPPTRLPNVTGRTRGIRAAQHIQYTCKPRQGTLPLAPLPQSSRRQGAHGPVLDADGAPRAMFHRFGLCCGVKHRSISPCLKGIPHDQR